MRLIEKTNGCEIWQSREGDFAVYGCTVWGDPRWVPSLAMARAFAAAAR